MIIITFLADALLVSITFIAFGKALTLGLDRPAVALYYHLSEYAGSSLAPRQLVDSSLARRIRYAILHITFK